MYKCNNCGAEFNDEVNYCPECGAMDVHENVVVVGIEPHYDGFLKYFKCEDEDIEIDDRVSIKGMVGDFKVFDVKRTTTLNLNMDINLEQVAKRIVNVYANNHYIERKIPFKEGKFQVRYHKDIPEEKKALDKYINLQIVKELCYIFGWVMAVASLVAAWFMFSGMEYSKVGMLIILSSALLFTFGALCKEQQRIEDVKYVCYKIEQLGSKIKSFNKKNLNVVYTKKNKIFTLTTRGKND